jgi:hypothetical protein
MAVNVKTLAAPSARAAAKLCNIPTGQTTLLPDHKAWLDTVVKDIVAKSPNPWVDLFGYASHLGDASSNKRLSDQRCEAVMNYIRVFNARCAFPQEFGFGDSKSTGGRMDDDGEWRAVEVYVYGSVPPGKRPRPLPPQPIPLPVPKEWFVTALNLSTFSVIVALGFTAATGTIKFQKANGDSITLPIGLLVPPSVCRLSRISESSWERFRASPDSSRDSRLSRNFLSRTVCSSSGSTHNGRSLRRWDQGSPTRYRSSFRPCPRVNRTGPRLRSAKSSGAEDGKSVKRIFLDRAFVSQSMGPSVRAISELFCCSSVSTRAGLNWWWRTHWSWLI